MTIEKGEWNRPEKRWKTKTKKIENLISKILSEKLIEFRLFIFVSFSYFVEGFGG